MATAGYSGTPLAKKLGIKPEQRILLVDAPADYQKVLGADISGQLVGKPPADLVHIFAVSRAGLQKTFKTLIKTLPSDATVWISWYKKSAKMETDITEDVIREIVLPLDWVDVKVCAVTDQWSGLKVVKRVSAR
jgi:hypothetical protein